MGYNLYIARFDGYKKMIFKFVIAENKNKALEKCKFENDTKNCMNAFIIGGVDELKKYYPDVNINSLEYIK